MRVWFTLWLALGAAFGAAGADGTKLIVISIDGLDYRYLRDADRLHLKIPVIRRLMLHGGFAEGVTGVPPTQSWPAVTTLVTGVPPSQHGVVSNDRLDQTSKVTTLWQAAMRAHKKTALLNWPATETASGDFVCPPYWEKPGQSDVPFDPMSAKCTPGLVARVASVYPRFTKSLWNDETAMLALDYLLQYEKPDLSMVHLADLSAEERDSGALSLYSQDILENDDELLGQMLTHMEPHTVVAIVSGNAYETADHLVRPKVLTHLSAVEVKYGLIGATDAKAAAALRHLVPVKKDGLAREVPMAEVRRFAPELKNWVAAFSTQPGYVAVNEEQGPGVGPGSHRGVSGMWPTRSGYRAAFVVFGDGVKPARLGDISCLEVAPTLASILGVRLPDAKQPSLWPRLKK